VGAQALPPQNGAGASQDVPELRALSNEELVRLMTDKAAYDAFVRALAEGHPVCRLQAQLRSQNEELAMANLAKEGEIGEIKNQIAIIRCLPPRLGGEGTRLGCISKCEQRCHALLVGAPFVGHAVQWRELAFSTPILRSSFPLLCAQRRLVLASTPVCGSE
jgi:hypothetical protein